MGRLQDKVAIITGGASGIGLASVERFVAEGARVVFTDLSAGDSDRRAPGGEHDGEAIAARLGDGARFVAADVTDADQLRAVFEAAVAEFGGLDVLFNNAGVAAPEGNIADCPDDLFDRIIDVNLKAVWRGIKLAAPLMTERGGGSIISTSSAAGLRGVPGMGSYTASKGGVIALTRAAAMELAASRIRVNCICPGGVITPIIYASPAFPEPLPIDLVRAGMADAQPFPRAGEAEDIANTAVFLASDDAPFLTGQAIAVDGGLTAESDSRNRAGAKAALGLE